MTGIVFYYEDSDTDVWSGKKNDAWNYSLVASGGFTDVIIINLSESSPEGINRAFSSTVVTSLTAATDLMTGSIAQIVCPWDYPDDSKTSVWDYNHAADWYIFGPAGGWHTTQISGSTKVYIPQAGSGALHSIHAATTILAHRYKVLQGL